MPEGANPDRRLVRYRESSYALNRAIQDQPAHTRPKIGPWWTETDLEHLN